MRIDSIPFVFVAYARRTATLRILSAVATLLVLTASSGCGALSTVAMIDLGGGWRLDVHSSWMPHAARRADLYRLSGHRAVLVHPTIGSYRYYGDDCLVYDAMQAAEHVYYGACGDRIPVVIERREYRKWKLSPEGLRSASAVRLENGRPVERVEVVPIDVIKAVAVRQAPFQESWLQAAARARPGIEPVSSEGPADVAYVENGRTLLLQATAEGLGTVDEQVEMVEALIAAGADVNAVESYEDSQGHTALMFASQKGGVEMARALIGAGADVNAQTKRGVTALMLATHSLQRRAEIVRLLVEAGADVTLRDHENKTALDWAAEGNLDAELHALLVRTPARRLSPQ